MPFEITLDWRSLRSIGASANLCLADPLAAWHTSTQTSPCECTVHISSDVLWCAEEFWRWVGVGAEYYTNGAENWLWISVVSGWVH